MQPQRLRVTDSLRASMGYRRFAGETPRMLVLRSNYWLDAACLNAAREMGWDVAETPVPQEGLFSREHLAAMLSRLLAFKPDFILTVNMAGLDAGGLLAGLFDDLDLYTVAWFVDNPRTIIPEDSVMDLSHMAALSWEKAYVPFLEARGFGAVNVLPLAADATVFDGRPHPAPTMPPAFVGNSMKDFADREWDWIARFPALSRELTAAFEDGRITRDAFAQGLDACLSAEACRAMDAEQRRHAEMLCFIEATRRLRVAGVTRLLPEGLHVYGDEAWGDCLPPERRHAYLNYEQDMPRFYNQCKVNLNITSVQMAHAVNQRVFDCPAAGGFLLSDAQADLFELFDPETEVAVYHDWDECRVLLRYYRRSPEARAAIIGNAQRRIQAEHCYTHRLRTIAAWLKALT